MPLQDGLSGHIVMGVVEGTEEDASTESDEDPTASHSLREYARSVRLVGHSAGDGNSRGAWGRIE